MTKQELKDKLLRTDLFVDNSYLDQYIQLVYDYKTDAAYTEIHHILQRNYYKYTNQQLDNSKSNTVRLAYKDHCKAHWLLYFCTTGYLKQANEASIMYIGRMYKKLTGKTKHKFDFRQKDFELLQKYMDDVIQDENSRYWPAEDVQFLQNNYGSYGSGPYCAEKLGKPLRAINEKAKCLGLTNNTPKWTEDEIAIIIKYYPVEGDQVYLRIPAHSKAACRAKAKELSIKTINHYWTDKETQILKINYPLVGPVGCSKLLPWRTPNKCAHKADRLGLVYENNPQRVWTESKLAILLQNKSSKISELKKLLGFKYSTIKKKLIELNLYNEQIHCSRHKRSS